MYTKGLDQCKTKIQTKYTLPSKIVHFRTRIYGAVLIRLFLCFITSGVRAQ